MEGSKVWFAVSRDRDRASYRARTDRNIGWITEEEQELIYGTTIGIAGCGGMGGCLAERFVRLGIGELRLADNESFDVSNLNRQFAATRSTLGRNKAVAVGESLRDIAGDVSLGIYREGITRDTVEEFVRGSHLICDEIEFWCIGSRLLLHYYARKYNVPIFVGNTAGFGVHLFFFDPGGIQLEECMGLGVEEALAIEEKMQNGFASRQEIYQVLEVMAKIFFFEWPSYSTADASWNDKVSTRTRLLEEGVGAIIATNPMFAAGFVADRVLLFLLDRFGVIARNVAPLPMMPGYVYIDAATYMVKTIKEAWW